MCLFFSERGRRARDVRDAAADARGADRPAPDRPRQRQRRRRTGSSETHELNTRSVVKMGR